MGDSGGRKVLSGIRIWGRNTATRRWCSPTLGVERWTRSLNNSTNNQEECRNGGKEQTANRTYKVFIKRLPISTTSPTYIHTTHTCIHPAPPPHTSKHRQRIRRTPHPPRNIPRRTHHQKRPPPLPPTPLAQRLQIPKLANWHPPQRQHTGV